MKKLLIVQPLHDQAIKLLENRSDITFEIIENPSEENLLHHICDADAMTVRMAELSEDLLSEAPRLRVISRHGVGYDNIPVDYCTRRGIPVTVVGPVNSISVAEHTLFLMLAATRVGVGLDSAVRESRFSARGEVRSVELSSKTLLVIGYGNIGRRVAERARALGMKVCVYDPHMIAAPEGDIARVDDLDDGLRQANVVTPSRAVDARNARHDRRPRAGASAGERRCAQRQPRRPARRSRTGRGCGFGRIARRGAGRIRDRATADGLTADRGKRIVLSPHSASLTEDMLIAMGVRTIENAIAGMEGKLDPDLVVNKQVLNQPARS